MSRKFYVGFCKGVGQLQFAQLMSVPGLVDDFHKSWPANWSERAKKLQKNYKQLQTTTIYKHLQELHKTVKKATSIYKKATRTTQHCKKLQTLTPKLQQL